MLLWCATGGFPFGFPLCAAGRRLCLCFLESKVRVCSFLAFSHGLLFLRALGSALRWARRGRCGLGGCLGCCSGTVSRCHGCTLARCHVWVWRCGGVTRPFRVPVWGSGSGHRFGFRVPFRCSGAGDDSGHRNGGHPGTRRGTRRAAPNPLMRRRRERGVPKSSAPGAGIKNPEAKRGVTIPRPARRRHPAPPGQPTSHEAPKQAR